MYKSSKNVQDFQSKMANIKNWNNYNINEYYLSILKLCKIKNLGQILNQIIILNVQLKTEKKNVNPNSIKFISIEDFIYKCLVNASIYCWKNAYLFAHKNLRPSEKQYHLNIIEKNIRKIIKITIRDCTPIELILNNTTDDTQVLQKKYNLLNTNNEEENNNKANNKCINPDNDKDNVEDDDEVDDDDEYDDEDEDDVEAVMASSSLLTCPILTEISPSMGTRRCLIPSRVLIAKIPSGICPRSTKYRAITRIPFPHISASEPSALR